MIDKDHHEKPNTPIPRLEAYLLRPFQGIYIAGNAVGTAWLVAPPSPANPSSFLKPRAKSVWILDERPALVVNPKVNDIVWINSDTGAHKEIWTRQSSRWVLVLSQIHIILLFAHSFIVQLPTANKYIYLKELRSAEERHVNFQEGSPTRNHRVDDGPRRRTTG